MEIDNLGHLDVDGNIILKKILNKWIRQPRYPGRGCCHDFFDSIKGRIFFDADLLLAL
jgi:hypothetical protein